jgi:hypothetical protein
MPGQSVSSTVLGALTVHNTVLEANQFREDLLLPGSVEALVT